MTATRARLTQFPPSLMVPARILEGVAMKRSYTKPVIAKREKLSAVTAAAGGSGKKMKP